MYGQPTHVLKWLVSHYVKHLQRPMGLSSLPQGLFQGFFTSLSTRDAYWTARGLLVLPGLWICEEPEICLSKFLLSLWTFKSWRGALVRSFLGLLSSGESLLSAEGGIFVEWLLPLNMLFLSFLLFCLSFSQEKWMRFSKHHQISDYKSSYQPKSIRSNLGKSYKWIFKFMTLEGLLE